MVDTEKKVTDEEWKARGREIELRKLYWILKTHRYMLNTPKYAITLKELYGVNFQYASGVEKAMLRTERLRDASLIDNWLKNNSLYDLLTEEDKGKLEELKANGKADEAPYVYLKDRLVEADLGFCDTEQFDLTPCHDNRTSTHRANKLEVRIIGYIISKAGRAVYGTNGSRVAQDYFLTNNAPRASICNYMCGHRLLYTDKDKANALWQRNIDEIRAAGLDGLVAKCEELYNKYWEVSDEKDVLETSDGDTADVQCVGVPTPPAE